MNGIVLVNKDRGISSNAVVNIVKKITNSKKAGHLGTLDVLGEGVLPVTLNKATKLFDYFLEKDKTYITTFKFGEERDTFDLEGEIVRTIDCDIKEEDVKIKIKEMIGRFDQLPPDYSAKKINGVPAYKLKRQGESVKLKTKSIEIYDFKLLKQEDKNIFTFEISCSSGTYIRSICRDLAEKLSTCGVMQRIIRTRCGNFMLHNTYTLEEIKNDKYEIIPVENLFDNEKLEVDENEFFKLKNGMTIIKEIQNNSYKVFFKDIFLGLGEVKENKLKMKLKFID